MDKYEHGGNADKNIIQYDFSANINPLGLPKGVRQVLCERVDAFTAYPDPYCAALREAIGRKECVDTAQVACGNGAVELIYKLLAVKRPERVLIPVPAFVEYEKAVSECGGQAVFFDMPEPFILTEDILPVLSEQCIDMVIICTPNNPTGQLIAPDLLQQIVDICVKQNIMLLIDACFMGFVDEAEQLEIHSDSNQVVILKAFTKLYAMAGLRLGYLLCKDTRLVERLQRFGPSWSVSVPAQLAGMAALGESSYVKQTKQLVAEERKYLEEALLAFHLQVYPSQANFILFYSDIPLADKLRGMGIAVRCCENYRGLGAGYYRIAVRSHQENVLFVQSLREILEEK